jgi:hypothetical protein
LGEDVDVGLDIGWMVKGRMRLVEVVVLLNVLLLLLLLLLGLVVHWIGGCLLRRARAGGWGSVLVWLEEVEGD